MSRSQEPIRLLFVCMGNICRSPTAEGAFRKLVSEAGLDHAFEIDSAGTLGYHAGEPPDRRSQKAALARGIDLSGLRARRVAAADFERFDLVLAMDRSNLDDLERACPPKHRHKLKLFLSYAPDCGVLEVPDPYYGGADGFERVLDLTEAASRGLLQALSARLSA